VDKNVVVDDTYFCVVFKHNYRAMKNQIAIYEAHLDGSREYERTVDIDFNGCATKTERVTIQSQDR